MLEPATPREAPVRDFVPDTPSSSVALRTFTNSDGRLWQVFDVTPSRSLPDVHGELAGGWLCFLSEGDRLRLAPVPQRWEELEEAALRTLLAGATPAPSSQTPPTAAPAVE
jgi:hypothetical protein